MPTYAIGDLQGCFDTLQSLLKKIRFNPDKDILWFTGDIVNRGPKSLETLRFIKNLGSKHKIVLGNHDLHLLAVAHIAHPGKKEDTLQEILNAADKNDLLDWLIQQPLLYHDKKLNFTLVHAGVCPFWDLPKALSLAKEVETVLLSNKAQDFFHAMYGDSPNLWNDNLDAIERWRCITNYLTRMRFCHKDGSLELKIKGGIETQSADLIPWFKMPNRVNSDLKIIFGHWAALNGITDNPNVFALDTGCVWGYKLTAMRLEDQVRFSVPFER